MENQEYNFIETAEDVNGGGIGGDETFIADEDKIKKFLEDNNRNELTDSEEKQIDFLENVNSVIDNLLGVSWYELIDKYLVGVDITKKPELIEGVKNLAKNFAKEANILIANYFTNSNRNAKDLGNIINNLSINFSNIIRSENALAKIEKASKKDTRYT